MGGGIGVGLRPELVHGLLAAQGTVDFLEVVAETANARKDGTRWPGFSCPCWIRARIRA